MLRSRDLQTELSAAAGRVEQRHLDHIRALGIAPATIARLGSNRLPAFGVVNAEIDRRGYYQPCEGPAHIVMPVTEGGDLVDLVAWRTTQPERWWLRFGTGWAIGADDLGEVDRWGGPAPMVYGSPLDWLRADCRGSVILDWSRDVMVALQNHAAIDCANSALAATLRDAIAQTVRLPKIAVTKEIRHAA